MRLVATGLTKLDPGGDDSREAEVDLDYYRTLSPAERFRMCVERSILLLDLARRHGADRDAAPLVKRR